MIYYQRYINIVFGFCTVEKACKKSFGQIIYLLQDKRFLFLSRLILWYLSYCKTHFKSIYKCSPGEVINMTEMFAIEKSIKSSKQFPPRFKPILLVLTKASLNSDSFIAAVFFRRL